MRCRVPVLAAVAVLAALPVFNGPSLVAADEEDPVVLTKKASEWMTILKEDKEPRRRKVALLALDQAGPRTRRVFVAVGGALRDDSDETVRIEAAARLGNLAVKAQMDKDRIPVDEPVDFLIQSLKSDRSPAVREASAKALQPIGLESKGAVSALAEALKEPHPGLRAAAAECLGKLELASRIDKSEGLTKPALPALIVALRQSKGKEYVRARSAVIYAIGRLGGTEARDAVGPLAEVLADPEAAPQNRRDAAETLGLFGKDANSAAPALAKLLDDKDVEVQRAAATALDRMGPSATAAIPEMVKSLSGKDRYVRCNCMHALSQMGNDLGEHTDTVILSLRNALKDNLADVRLAAVNGLAALGGEVLGKNLAAVKAELRVALRDTSSTVRDAAETALKKLEGLDP